MNKSKKTWAKELLGQGLEVKEIAKITGLAEKTVYTYRSEMKQQESAQANKFPMEKQIEWTQAVNRIRKHYGKKPFPMPYPEV